MQSDIALSLGEPAGDALLDEALNSYRRIRLWLRLPAWRWCLLRHADLLSWMRARDPAVERVLEKLPTRARQDWPSRLLRRARSVAFERDGLCQTARKRVRSPDALSLVELLERLEREAFAASSERLSRRGMSSWAESLLFEGLEDVKRVRENARQLEGLFLRPVRLSAFPWSPEEMETIALTLPEAEAGVRRLWQRVAQLEPTQRLLRTLEREARHRPVGKSARGPDVLVHGAFWTRAARSRLSESLRSLFPREELEPSELIPVALWSAHRASGGDKPLGPTLGLGEGRAALLDFLANWLWVERKPREPEGWWKLEESARRLDAAPPTQAREAAVDPLRRFIRLRVSTGRLLPRESSVVGWVRTAWAMSSAVAVDARVPRPW